jgi:hypothetical protein
MKLRDVLFFVAGAAAGALMVVLLQGSGRGEHPPLPAPPPALPVDASPEPPRPAMPDDAPSVRPKPAFEFPPGTVTLRQKIAAVIEEKLHHLIEDLLERVPLDDSIVPHLVDLARALNEEGESPLAALELLAALGTPTARSALADLFADAEFAEPETVCLFARPLLEVIDPRIGPLVISRFHEFRRAGMKSPVHTGPMAILLARHGGDEGCEILGRLIDKGQGPGYSSAMAALQYGRDERLLDLALRAIRRGGSFSKDSHNDTWMSHSCLELCHSFFHVRQVL